MEVGPDGKGILTVFRVKINVNLRTETIEQLREKKKTMHVSSFRVLRDETQRQLQGIGLQRVSEQPQCADDMREVAAAAVRQVSHVVATKVQFNSDETPNP